MNLVLNSLYERIPPGQRTIDVESVPIPENPRVAGTGKLGSIAAPALLGGAAMTGMRMLGGESLPSAVIGSGLSTAGGIGGQMAGESAARMAGKTAGKLFTEKIAQTAAGQAGKALAAKAAGTAIGSAIGSVIPGAGTFVGGAIGSIVGGIAGDMLGRKITGGMQKQQFDPMTGGMMVDENGNPVTQTSYAPDIANGMVPGAITAQEMFDMTRQRNANMMSAPPSFGM